MAATTCLGFFGSTAMSLTMFLYAASVGPEEVLPPQFDPAWTSTLPASSLISGIQEGLGAKPKVQAPALLPAAWYQMPRLVAAKTVEPPPKRIRPIVVDSSSLPPTLSVGREGSRTPGCRVRKTPAPTKEVAPVLASPVANHSEPSPASWRSPPLSEGSVSAIDVHAPPPWEERQTPPSAPAAYTWLALSAAQAGDAPRDVTRRRREELE